MPAEGISAQEILEATKRREQEKFERQRARQEKKRLREQLKRRALLEKLVAPFLLLLSIGISLLLMAF